MGQTMRLKVTYDPETDTLDLGNGQPGSDGQPIAERLVAFFNDDDEVVGITLENAAEILAPIWEACAGAREADGVASVLRDDGDAV